MAIASVTPGNPAPPVRPRVPFINTKCGKYGEPQGLPAIPHD
jgi:hypothetical protein